MTVYSVQVFKEAFGYRWSNRYHVEAASIEAVATDAQEMIVVPEQNIHPTYINFTELLISTAAKGDRAFINVPLELLGLRSTGTDRLPFFNTAMAKFSVGGVGDPSRKYYRCLTEGDSNGGVLQSATRAAILDECLTMITGAATAGMPLCQLDGTLLTDAAVQLNVQERQMHRRNKKKVVPPGP
jgi:hypothetical protein